MSEIARRIDEVIRTGLAPALKAQGYKKAARTFRRREPGHTLVVNVQGSSWNSDDDGSFTLNLGVYFPTVVPFLDWMRAVERPTEPDCVVRQRIGFVMPLGLDHWWSISPDTDLDALAREVRDAWEQFGRPWLESHANLEAARALALSRNTPYWAAAISLAMNEQDSARVHLEEALAAAKNNAAVTTRLRDWGTRHGIISQAPA